MTFGQGPKQAVGKSVFAKIGERLIANFKGRDIGWLGQQSTSRTIVFGKLLSRFSSSSARASQVTYEIE